MKLLLNSVLSRKGSKFVTFDIRNFYLQTPLDRPEYVRIKLADIPLGFVNEYKLKYFVDANGWCTLRSETASMASLSQAS